MKKWTAAIGLSVMILGGCGVIEEANNTLTYATDVTEFLNETQQLASEVPALLEKAAENPDMIQDVQEQLEKIKEDVESIQNIDAPLVAEGVHSKLLDYSAQLETSVTNALNQINNGAFDPSAFMENSEFTQIVKELQELQTAVEKIGQ